MGSAMRRDGRGELERLCEVGLPTSAVEIGNQRCGGIVAAEGMNRSMRTRVNLARTVERVGREGEGVT